MRQWPTTRRSRAGRPEPSVVERSLPTSLVGTSTLSIGKAAAYVIANWERLTRFVGDVRIPLDNNATERGIRGPVVGRRNHFGSKSERGTQVAATFYTLIETAKLQGMNPAEYLLEAIRDADRGEVLLPAPLSSALRSRRGAESTYGRAVAEVLHPGRERLDRVGILGSNAATICRTAKPFRRTARQLPGCPPLQEDL